MSILWFYIFSKTICKHSHCLHPQRRKVQMLFMWCWIFNKLIVRNNDVFFSHFFVISCSEQQSPILLLNMVKYFLSTKEINIFSKIKCYSTMLFSSTYNQICNAIYFKPINLDRNRRGFGKWREISPIVSLSRSWGFRKSGRKLGWASHWKKNFQQPLLPRNLGNVIKLFCHILNICNQNWFFHFVLNFIQVIG